MQRRTLLRLGAGSALVLLVAGTAVSLLQPGLKDGRLSAAARDVFTAVGRGVLDGSLPTEAGPRQIAVNGLLDRIDALAFGLPAHAQAELSQLLGLLATSAGRRGLAGLAADWPLASVTEVQQALQSMRTSSLSLRQQAYHALHDIVGGAYFSDASTWPQLGYPGPPKI